MTKTKLNFIPGKLWKTFSNFVRKQVRITHWNVLYSLNSLGHIFTIPYQIIVHICIIYNPKIILGSSWTLARGFQQRRRLAIKLQTSLSESDRILKMAHPHHFWLRFVFLFCISSFVFPFIFGFFTERVGWKILHVFHEWRLQNQLCLGIWHQYEDSLQWWWLQLWWLRWWW